MNFLRRRIWGLRVRAWLALVFGLPVLCWGAVNLFFSTSYGTAVIEKRLAAQLELPCELERVTWSPWAGVTVVDLQFLAPPESGQADPLLAIERITVDPAWSQLVRGHKRWERMEFGKVTINLSLEALREMVSRYQVVRRRRAPEVVPEAEPQLAETGEAAPTMPEEEEVGPAPGPADESGPEDALVSASEPVDDFQGLVVFSEVNVRLFSTKSSKWDVKALGLRGEIPVWGAKRKGGLTVARLALGEQLAEEALDFPIEWRDHGLFLDQWEATLFGLDLRVSAMLKASSGFPVGVQIDLPTQEVDLTPLNLHRTPPLEIGELMSVNRLQGYLLKPQSFRGSSLSRFEDFVWHGAGSGNDLRFERGGSFVNLSPSGLLVNDVRFLGEEEAVLANGFVTAGGESAATVRVVASPERARSYEQKLNRASTGLTFDFGPLVTPDREFRDIRLEWRQGEAVMDLGEDRAWVPLLPTLGAILRGREAKFSQVP